MKTTFDMPTASNLCLRQSFYAIAEATLFAYDVIGRTRPKSKRRNRIATFTNKATLTYNGRSTDSNTVVGNFAQSLTVTKTALGGTYLSGGDVTYVISIINSGSVGYTGLTVTDNLGAYPFGTETLVPLDYVQGSLAYYINGVLQPALAVGDTPPLSISGVSVPAAGNAMLIYEAAVNDKAPLDVDGVITNNVTVSGASLPEPVTASETVNAIAEAMLSITKSLFPTTVTENGALSYTFVIENSGNTPVVATDNAVVTDVFDPILNITSVTLDGALLTEGTDYTYNATTGEFATAIGTITVPAATYTQNPDGSVTIVPSAVTLVVNGTI